MAKKEVKKVDWLICLIMSILFGNLGVDRFMMGKIGTGILKLITFGGFGIWWFVDVILISTKHEYEGVVWKDDYKKQKKSAKINKFAIISISILPLSWLLALVVPYLVPLLFLTFIVSIILGFVALEKIKKTGERGRALAVVSIILGFFFIVVTFALITIGIIWAVMKNALEAGTLEIV